MKYENSKTISKTFITLKVAILLTATSAISQIGQLGIYGSAPENYRTNVRYVLLQDYPEYDGGLIYFLPVNGRSNFNFYYNPDGTGFLPTGTYKLTYLNGTLNTSYGDDIVYYSANSGHTNGVQIRAFYNPPSTPLGVHGVVKVYVPGGGGTTTPLENATIRIRPLGGGDDVLAQTNANGYFSVYYENDNFGHFLVR